MIIAVVAYILVMWVALVAWVYRDVRQRSRDPILQFVSVLLVLLFFLPGHWIYLILRPRHTLKEVYDRALEEEALLQELEDQKSCGNCRRRVQEEWLLCPSCGLQLKEPCNGCERPLSYSWVVCPHCGLEKAPRPGVGIRPARRGNHVPDVRQPARAPAPEVRRPREQAPAAPRSTSRGGTAAAGSRGATRSEPAHASPARSERGRSTGRRAEPAARAEAPAPESTEHPEDEELVIGASFSMPRPADDDPGPGGSDGDEELVETAEQR